MARSPSSFAIASVLCLSLFTAGVTWAQTPAGKPVVGMTAVMSYSGEAKVTAIDQGTRMVTLATADGRSRTHRVSELVQNFDQVKVGDTVTAAYEERLSFVLSEPGARKPRGRDAMVGVGAPKGQMPAGAMVREQIANFTVVSTDVQANTITLVGADGGQVRTFNVVDPDARRELPRAKPGDSLTVIKREVLVADVTRKS